MSSITTRSVFTREFTSADQTITSAGALTIAHGLGIKPKITQFYLVCQTAELGYSIGDVVELENGWGQSTNAVGMSVVCDATNINVRYGSNAAVFYLINKTTGASNTTVTNANWRLRVSAYA